MLRKATQQNGDLAYTGNGFSNEKAPISSPLYHAANYSFLKYYNKLFNANFSTRVNKCLY